MNIEMVQPQAWTIRLEVILLFSSHCDIKILTEKSWGWGCSKVFFPKSETDRNLRGLPGHGRLLLDISRGTAGAIRSGERNHHV